MILALHFETRATTGLIMATRLTGLFIKYS